MIFQIGVLLVFLLSSLSVIQTKTICISKIDTGSGLMQGASEVLGPNYYNDSICQELRGYGIGLKVEKRYKESYDSLRSYVEHCYWTNLAASTFPSITGAAQSLPEGNEKWINYREWLKSVLYLNTVDPMYYCQDVDAILSSFQYKDPKRGIDINGAAAVAKYIIESNKCPDLSKNLGRRYSESRQEQYDRWRDTVKVDTNLYKLDTTLPSLEEIDLEILRGLNGVDSKPYTLNGSALGVLTSSNNPFRNETELSLKVNKLAYIRFEVFNELGQIVIGEGSGKVYEPGKHRFVLNGSSLNSGVYYVRFSTLRDEVKTIKLRHIK